MKKLFKKNENPILLCFILLKYTDEISYDKIFNCLSENLKFNPQIIHTDFEKSLLTSIKKYSLLYITRSFILLIDRL